MTFSGTDIFLFALLLYVVACFIAYLETVLYPFMDKRLNIGKLKRMQKCYRNIATRAWIAVPVLWLGGILMFPKVTVITQVEPEKPDSDVLSTFRCESFLVPFYYKDRVMLPGDKLLNNDTDSTLVRYEVTKMHGLFMTSPTLEESEVYKPRSMATFEYTRYKFKPLSDEYFNIYSASDKKPETEEYLTLKGEAIREMAYIRKMRHDREIEEYRVLQKSIDLTTKQLEIKYKPRKE